MRLSLRAIVGTIACTLLLALRGNVNAIDPLPECHGDTADADACTEHPLEHVIKLHTHDAQLARTIADDHGMRYIREVSAAAA